METNENKPASLLRKILKSLGYHQRFFWTTFWLCFGFAIILIPLFFADSDKVRLPPAFLAAFACLVGGILIGFIFGVPTIINNNLPATTTNQIAQGSMDLLKAQKVIEANTNLTQISDWFTKVIIGAGLVELKQLPGFVSSIATSMGRGIATDDIGSLSYATVLCGGIILAFSIYGFIFGYLIMRIVLTEIFS